MYIYTERNIPRIFPVSESLGVVVRTTAHGEDKGKENNGNNDNDLERGQPKLKFTKELDAKIIDADDDDEEDGDEDTRIDIFAIDPELNGEGSGRQLIGSDDDVLEPITASEIKKSVHTISFLWYFCLFLLCNVPPTKGESKRRITEARRITSKASRHGQPSSHFTQRRHDEEDNKADNRVGDEDGAGTSLSEGLASSNDETGTDGTTNGNHGDVTGLETSVQHGLLARLETADVLLRLLVALVGATNGVETIVVVGLFDVVARRDAPADAVTHDGLNTQR